MSIIQTLPPHVANLIAAGEVVERPASIIKELMENAVDAGADVITVEIKNGGIDSICITDNGCGMSREDASACFIRHATSKIHTQEDLTAILTLGFRGEALAAISAVSKIDLVTRRAEDLAGTRVCCEAGRILSVEDAGCPVGTSITVREIFFNTPARMKFLKKNSTEGNYCAAAVDYIALSHPEIAFRFLKDGRISMRTPGDGQILSAILGVCGQDFVNTLIPIPSEGNSGALGSQPEVWGYITRPERALSSRSSQYFLLNGRHIRSRTLTAAVEEAYRSSIMTGKYPGCVLYVSIDPGHVDVNVHPAKLEVKFSDERAAFHAVYDAVKRALTAADRPHFSSNTSTGKEPEPQLPQVFPALPAQSANPMASGNSELKNGLPPGLYTQTHRYTASVNISAEEFSLEPADDIFAVPPASMHDSIPEQSEPSESRTSVQDIQTEAICFDGLAEDVSPAGVSDDGCAVPAYRIIGEIFKCYILVELDDALLYIDKHAAHERILYNKLKVSVEPPPGQMLLAPLILPIAREDRSLLEENEEELTRLGLEFTDFGGGNILIHSIPAHIDPDDTAAFIDEVCQRMKKNENDDRREDILHSIACKAAIKAGWTTQPQEIEALVRAVLADPQLRYCPHGRPVALTLRRRDFEKEFFRT